MEKSLVTSNFSFSHSVFKRLILQTGQNQGLFGKGLNGGICGRAENNVGKKENFLLLPQRFQKPFCGVSSLWALVLYQEWMSTLVLFIGSYIWRKYWWNFQEVEMREININCKGLFLNPSKINIFKLRMEITISLNHYITLFTLWWLYRNFVIPELVMFIGCSLLWKHQSNSGIHFVFIISETKMKANVGENSWICLESLPRK